MIDLDPDSTRGKLLITAEQLFAKFGLYGVSLRQITRIAGVNLASVNYHYFDKESLYREIITQRLRAINATRLTELKQAEERMSGAPVPVAEIMGIMARPLFLTANNPATYNDASRQLLGRIYLEPLPFSEELLGEELQPVMVRFGQALRRHAPRLSPQDFLWRYSMIVGAMHHAMATLHSMKHRTLGVCREEESEKALENFIISAAQVFTP